MYVGHNMCLQVGGNSSHRKHPMNNKSFIYINKEIEYIIKQEFVVAWTNCDNNQPLPHAFDWLQLLIHFMGAKGWKFDCKVQLLNEKVVNGGWRSNFYDLSQQPYNHIHIPIMPNFEQIWKNKKLPWYVSIL